MYSSKNLQKKIRNLTTIEDWFETPTPEGHTASNWLSQLISDSFGNNNIFSSIYVAIRRNPENASQEETEVFDYYNVGYTPLQVAEYFNTKFSLNYFAYDYNDSAQYQQLKTRIMSIYYANIYKYRKLIETMGYKYNPLYNVDANELYSNMESIGDTSSDRTPSGKIINRSGTELNNAIGPTTTTTYTNPYDQNTSQSADYVSDKTEQSAVTSTQEYDNYSETSNVYNKPADHYTYNPNTGKYEKTGIFSVAASDSAFGVALGGAERYYAEKRIRKGNIGVTKSTELIESQRNVVKFNILDEFINDLARDVVVMIF